MDILSILPQSPAAPRVAGSPPTRGKPDPAKVPDRPDPAAAPTERADGQKEAIGQGQKTRQNLLDLLEDAVPGTKSLLADGQAKTVLSEIALPPTLDDMVKALASMGIALPALAGPPTAPVLAEAIKASDLGEGVKATLAKLVEAAVPVPAADVIALERPNPVPVPVTGRPAPKADTGPTPHAEPAPKPAPHAGSGPAPHAGTPPVPVAQEPVPQAVIRPDADAVVVRPTQTSPMPAPTAESAPVAAFVAVGQAVAQGQRFDQGLAEDLNVVEIAAESEVPIVTTGRVPAPTMVKTEDVAPEQTPLTTGPVPEDRSAAEVPERPMPQPHAEAGRNPDPKPELGRPDKTAGTGRTDGPDPHAETRNAPKPDPKADSSVLGRPDRTARTNDPAQAWIRPAVGNDETAPVESKAAMSGAFMETELDASNVLDVDPVEGSESVEAVSTPAPTAAAHSPKSSERAPLPKETVDSVHRQVADRIETMVSGRRSGSVTVKLNPTDLGTITLTVKNLGSRVDTEIKASNEDVRLALQAHRQDLVQNVESRGLTMNSFNVGQDAQPQGGQDHRSAFVEAQRQANLKAAVTSAPESRSAVSVAARPSTSGVDYLA
ncbi:MAG: flagellar hook-length control protein FliK [Armatimonadetes bacterium]|nr:flagellar hook-length control protein FliK [Armatimonadota bacterium]